MEEWKDRVSSKIKDKYEWFEPEKTLIEYAYRLGESFGLSTWTQDKAGPSGGPRGTEGGGAFSIVDDRLYRAFSGRHAV